MKAGTALARKHQNVSMATKKKRNKSSPKHNRKELEEECKDFIKNFGQRIKQLRLERGWTLEDTEANGYTSWRHWGEVETKQKNVNLSTVYRMAQVLNIKPHELLKD